MIDFIYTVFIAPLEYWMKVVLLWGHGVCSGNWGWAIVLMSLVVNTVILPIYMKAESWQEEEQRIRLGFEAKESMIKRVFKGQERFAMISTMRRQAGYTAFLSMRSSLGFFLQIPFFFAAYHFLSHFEPLLGVSFMGLADLGRPDEAIKIGGFAINVMPILMTVINIGSALIYTKNLAKRDKIQLYAMAALFLVLLYDAASGLVLYWTCNNIYSLGKNIVYDLVRKLKAPKEAIARIFTRKKAVIEKVEGVSRLRGLLAIGLWLVGLTLGLLSSGQNPFFEGSVRRLFELAANATFALSMLWCAKEALSLLFKKRWLLALFLFAASVGCVSYWYQGTFGRVKPFFTVLLGLWSLIPVLSLTFARYEPKNWLYPRIQPESLYTPAAFWLVILLCNYLPIQSYCTAPELFSSPEVVLAKLLLDSAVFGAVLYLAGKLWQLLGVMRTASVITTFIAVLFTIYAFLLPLDVGTIDGFQIEHPENLYRLKNIFLDVGIFAALGFLFYRYLRRGGVPLLRFGLTFACVASFAAGLGQLWATKGQWVTDSQSRRTELPSYNDEMLGFTQKGKNRLVFVLDAFSGRHMASILRKNPDLNEAFSGFIWYPDTLAQGFRTSTSIATLICGDRCTVGALNEGKREALSDKINRLYAQELNRYGENTDIFVNEHNWLEAQRIAPHATAPIRAVRYLSSAYLNRYANKHGIEINVGASDEFLTAVSLFSSVPWSMKAVVYFDGHWVTQAIGYWTSDRVANRLQEWAFLDELPEISNANMAKDTYKFFHSEITHYPWLMVPGKCGIVKDPGPGQNYPQQAVEVCSLRALARWFDWMKENKVYDNTTIVIASDHGAGSGARKLNALLLVKPQNAPQEPMRRDDSLMKLSDVPAIVSGDFKKPEANRERVSYDIDKIADDYYKGATEIRVRGPLKEKSSWPKKIPMGSVPE